MRRTLIVAAAVGAALLGASQTAYAGYDCQTGNLGGRGYGAFHSYGEHLLACDIKPDGLRTTAYGKYLDLSGIFHIRQISDPNGAEAGCGNLDLDFPEGRYIEVWACVDTVGCTPHIEGRA